MIQTVVQVGDLVEHREIVVALLFPQPGSAR
jgi:hypothetical protein